MRAAEYVRMSTEAQEYSIVNQQAAIGVYAARHQFEVVKTYSDPAKSGLDIKHRPGLQALLDDVLSGRMDFKAVLVFDISRWGRFQDNDEAACYEFLCKRAGIAVHYCAEPFSNDGTLASSFLKMVKRTMAAEYLRELSAKVRVGQCRLASCGFKQGGRAGFGLRRLLLDSQGNPKMLLQDGERKNLTTERVIYTLGPEEEIRTVRLIYSMFLDNDMAAGTIAGRLNEQEVSRSPLGPWTTTAVYHILTHPKYAGCIAFNRTSETLRSKRVRNPPDRWVLCENSFPAIVSKDVFERAQEKFENMVSRRSDERLLAELRGLAQRHGKLVPALLTRRNGVASAATYKTRFGSLMQAYELIQYRGARYTREAMESRRTVATIKNTVVAQLRASLIHGRITWSRRQNAFRVSGHSRFDIEIGRCFTTPKGHLRWKVNAKRITKHGIVIVRLQRANDRVLDFVVMPEAPRVAGYFTLTEAMASSAKICSGEDEVLKAVLQRLRQIRRQEFRRAMTTVRTGAS